MKNNYKKESPLPTLVGLGGGSNSFSYSGGSSFSFNDDEYDNFFTANKAPINISNSSYDQFYGSNNAVGGTHEGLGVFFDTSRSRIYAAYPTSTYYGWNNSSGTYAGNANYYALSSTRTNMNGTYGNNLGRDMTVAYLGDDTQVFVQSNNNGNNTLQFFNSAGYHMGGLTLTTGGTNQPVSQDHSIAFSGTHLLLGVSSHDYIYAYDLPADSSTINTNNTTSITPVAKYYHNNFGSITYGMAWGGDNRVYICTSSGATQYLLTDNDFSGTATSVASYTWNGNNYSLGMDYKNRKLVLGGYSIVNYYVFGE